MLINCIPPQQAKRFYLHRLHSVLFTKLDFCCVATDNRKRRFLVPALRLNKVK